MAVTKNGEVYGWGGNTVGAVGAGKDVDVIKQPKRIIGPWEVKGGKALHSKKKVIALACGYEHTAILTNHGELYVWGGNDKGQLGLGHTQTCFNPRLITITVDKRECMPFVTGVACAIWHTAAVTREGALYTWGAGENGQLGHNCEKDSLLPKRVLAVGKKKCKQVQCGDFFTIFVTTEHDVYSFGEGFSGELGLGKNIVQVNFPKLVQGELLGRRVSSLACGSNHTLVLLESGSVCVWGSNAFGQLGIESEGDTVHEPILVTLDHFGGRPLRQVSCGGVQSMVVSIFQWVYDEEKKDCMTCHSEFSLTKRRHHCRNCGGLFCGECSSSRQGLSQFNGAITRVCNKCYNLLCDD
eukprot:TRINITY_DN14189_c0_g1_i1.p1 TRINITY_DN14189_c0_g1~~TRINITY_DN14189_c0_g1_i1.p1  ORF type:complete len:405 (+),score=34.30 TRINITY_DN14189_c0_g1_i1:156-1217(+)